MKIIHINRHVVLKNKKHGNRAPEIVVRNSRSDKHPEYANTVEILDENGNVVAVIGSHYIDPLPCGATVFIECKHDVRAIVTPTGDVDAVSV